jgi:hypothetical protein
VKAVNAMRDLTRPNLLITCPSLRAWVTDFQLQSLPTSNGRVESDSHPGDGICAETRAARGNRRYERCSWSANGRLDSQQSLTPLFSICQSGQEHLEPVAVTGDCWPNSTTGGGFRPGSGDWRSPSGKNLCYLPFRPGYQCGFCALRRNPVMQLLLPLEGSI